MVVVLDLDAPIFQVQGDLAAQVVGHVQGQAGVVAGVVSHLIAAVVGGAAAVPLGLNAVDMIAGALGAVLILHTVEDIELVLRAHHHGVGNTGLLQILGGAAGHVAGILVEGAVLGPVDDHDVADHTQRGDGGKLVDGGAVQIRHEHHVAALHGGVTVVGAVEAHAVGHGVLVEPPHGDAQVAPAAVDVGHFEVNDADLFFLAQLQNVLQSLFHGSFSSLSPMFAGRYSQVRRSVPYSLIKILYHC